MKIYSTVTGDRGKEVGKGSNQNLVIAVKIDDREHPKLIMRVERHPDDRTTVELIDVQLDAVVWSKVYSRSINIR